MQTGTDPLSRVLPVKTAIKNKCLCLRRVTDITYIPIWTGDDVHSFCYLSMISDHYTKEILGWHVGETLEAWHSVECLLQAVTTLEGEAGTDSSITLTGECNT